MGIGILWICGSAAAATYVCVKYLDPWSNWSDREYVLSTQAEIFFNAFVAFICCLPFMRLFDSVSDTVLYSRCIKQRRSAKADRLDEENEGFVAELVDDVLAPIGLHQYTSCFYRHKHKEAMNKSLHEISGDSSGTATDDANYFLTSIGVGLP